MKTKILFFSSLLVALVLISFSLSTKAQIVIDPQPYINSSGSTVGNLNVNGTLAVTGIIGPQSSINMSAGTSTYGFNGRANIGSPSDGVITLFTSTQGDVSLLPIMNFGGTTSAFPAIRRNGASIEFLKADASAYAPIRTSQYVTNAGGSDAASISSSAVKLIQFNDAAGTTGTEINNGTPTLGTCTGGSIVSGSHNIAGSYTGNTSSSCIINFGTPNFTNAPLCIAMSQASTTHPRISAVSVSSITVTGGVSGEAITYHCIGRIGT